MVGFMYDILLPVFTCFMSFVILTEGYIFIDLRERGREREKERVLMSEGYIDQLPSMCAPTEDQTCDLRQDQTRDLRQDQTLNLLVYDIMLHQPSHPARAHVFLNLSCSIAIFLCEIFFGVFF